MTYIEDCKNKEQDIVPDLLHLLIKSCYIYA